MRDHVHGCADFGERLEDCGRHHDVGKLRDRRICKHALQVSLAQRDEACGDDRKRRRIQQPAAARHREQVVDAEDIDNDLRDREHAGLDDRNGVQQRADRCRRHHRRRQPAMHGHHGRLADAEHEQPEQQAHRWTGHLAFEDAAWREVAGAGRDVGPDDGR